MIRAMEKGLQKTKACLCFLLVGVLAFGAALSGVFWCHMISVLSCYVHPNVLTISLTLSTGKLQLLFEFQAARQRFLHSGMHRLWT